MNTKSEFYEALRKERGERFYEAFKRLENDVRIAFELVKEEGGKRIQLLPKTGENSYIFVLQDDGGIGEYYLYSLHVDGSIRFHFEIDSIVDENGEVFRRKELEQDPIRWCRRTYGSAEKVPFNEFPLHYSEFHERLKHCIRTFASDVESILGS